MDRAETGKYCLEKLLKSYTKIVIPSLQRDYVMAANQKIFDQLFQDMKNMKENGSDDFDFGCIIGHKDEQGKFQVYDGQQRIVTLVLLICCKSQNSDNDMLQDMKDTIKGKFAFEGRTEANEFLKTLCEGSSPDKKHICDLTTNTIYDFSYDFSNNCPISPEFCWERVKFQLLEVGERDTAEQLFIDMNEGVKLEDYEIFKSMLDGCVKDLMQKEIGEGKEVLENWSSKIDNEWLDWFYANSEKEAEKNEMEFLRYCLNMILLENDNEKNEEGTMVRLSYNDIEQKLPCLKSEDFVRTYNVMEQVTSRSSAWYRELLDVPYYSNDHGCCFCLTKKIPDISTKRIGKCGISTPDNFTSEVLLWCCISNLSDDSDAFLQEYWRLIKKLLNANRIYYPVQIYYGIPQIYASSIIQEEKYLCKTDEYRKLKKQEEEYLCNVLLMNKYYGNFKKQGSMKNALKWLNNHLNEKYIEKFKDVIKQEQTKYSSPQYDEIRKFEDDCRFNGLVDNILKDEVPVIPYNEFQKRMANKPKSSSNSLDLSEIFQFYREISSYVDRWDDIVVEGKVCFDNKSYVGYFLRKRWTEIFTDENTRWKFILQNWLNKVEVKKEPLDDEVHMYLQFNYAENPDPPIKIEIINRKPGPVNRKNLLLFGWLNKMDEKYFLFCCLTKGNGNCGPLKNYLCRCEVREACSTADDPLFTKLQNEDHACSIKSYSR